MEELIFFVLGILILVAWGLALVGVPLLFRRIKTLESRVLELSIKVKTSAERQIEKPIADNESKNSEQINESARPEEYEEALTNAYSEVVHQAIEVTSIQAQPVEPDSQSQPADEYIKTPESPSWLERQLSTHLTAKIGAIILIFGAVFLAKYTADIGLFSLTARLWSMGLAGLGIALLGAKLSQRRAMYGHVLQGTGFAIWLATWFASHVVYELVGWVPTLIACVFAVLFVGYRAIKQNSQVLAFIALLGGFIAPFIASSDASSLWRLFSYLLVLNIGAAWIVQGKPWKWFLRLSYLGSLILVSLLMTAEYLQGDLSDSQVQTPLVLFILGLVVLYSLLAAKWVMSGTPLVQKLLPGLTITVPAMAGLAVYAILKDSNVIIAAVYLTTACWYGVVWHRTSYRGFAATAIVAASLAVPFALNDLLSSLIYSIEGAAFFVFAVRQQRWLYLVWASLIQVAGAFFAIHLFTDSEVLTNSSYLAWPLFGAVVGAGIFSSWTLYSQQGFELFNAWLQKGFFAWSLFWWLYLWGFYSAEVFSTTAFVTVCLGVMPLTLALISWAHYKLNWSTLVSFHWLLTALALVAAAVFYAELGSTATNSDISLVCVILLGYWTGRLLLSKIGTHTIKYEGLALWFGFPFVLGLLITQLGQMQTDWHVLGFFLPFVLLFSTHQKVLPLFFDYPATQRNILAWSVGVVMVVSLVTVTSIGDYSPWPFVAIVHPISMMIILLGYSLLKLNKAFSNMMVPVFFWCALMLTIELNRILFHYYGVGFQLDAWLSSALTQMVWSLVWSIVGAFLMLLGAKKSMSRRMWFSGAAVLGVVVLKLFLLDLSNVDTLFRILSFIGVGGLLLAVGYFAPLPLPRES
ncbi:DUF2339 domain-containing protein [Reinekea marina]|uniref:DUF2339 domain-containing protein n=1 Tax=Reinekea marina TaxID=1310421 RepID=A0ABV7WWY7_9GAMM|nr:DUF2339 domain-containing protein [Reinekea marina]MDN3648840.1 DUF2339 domain-containing protein [Reinekea marina]